MSSFDHTPFNLRQRPALNVQGSGLGLGNVRSIRLESGSDLGSGELLHLLRGPTNKGTGVEEALKLGDDGVEEGGAADTVEQVVVLALLLDVVGGLVGENAYRHGSVRCESKAGDIQHLRISSWAS